MSVIQGDQAIQRLAAVLRRRDDPDDEGPLAEVGKAWDEVLERMRSYVDQTGNACKGKITFTIDLKAKRNGNEVSLEVETGTAQKAPSPPKRATILYLDRDAVANTSPVQDELPMFQVKDGGKKNGDSAKKATV